MITQDLVYDRVHAFVGGRAFDSWAAALRNTHALGYPPCFQGTVRLEDRNSITRCGDISGLRKRRCEVEHGAEFKSRLISEFPDHRGAVLLDHQMRFLFPERSPRPLARS